MSSMNTDLATPLELPESAVTVQTPAAPIVDQPIGTEQQRLHDAIQNVTAAIAPVWPLRDFVAVNPFLGLADREFMKARRLLRSVCDCETLMPLSYYRQRYQQGEFEMQDVEAAVRRVNSQDSLSRMTVERVLQTLLQADDTVAPGTPGTAARILRTLTEHVDQSDGTSWTAAVCEEVGRHCAAYYDEGQASWASPWKHLPLYQAWRSAARIDRRLELLGVSGCRDFLGALPHTADAAVAFLLQHLRMPEDLWEPFLLCQAHSVPGWSSWTKFRTQSQSHRVETLDFLGLLAIRLAYDVAVAEAAGLQVDWCSVASRWNVSGRSAIECDGDAAIRFTLLHATEEAYRRRLLGRLSEAVESCDGLHVPRRSTSEQPAEGARQQPSGSGNDDASASVPPLAQLVFCIDVRSERYRRNLENVSSGLQTFGFAGFFGIPIAFQREGEGTPVPHVPALISPSFTVFEGLRDANSEETSRMRQKRRQQRRLRAIWKQFQSSASACFAFVETAGLTCGWKLFSKTFNQRSSAQECRFDGVSVSDHHRLGPVFSGLDEQGIDQQKLINLAESMLRGIGLTQNFAKLVVLCGHRSQSQNNPLQAGLDCGACCGHSGEPNARFAAALLNQPGIRAGLSARGIDLPEDTRFLAALHNTTGDDLTFFDTDLLPESLQPAFRQLREQTAEATGLTQLERLPQLRANSEGELLQRTLDWSEVRPEWGLAGNAAFIVAPRELTRNANLDGRAFLHSYDSRSDPGFKVLEQIMTAPMVVGHWINMQYYASTVDNQHYGSGSKTIHNVVGRFGVFSGNGGDLTAGLPWQSVHNGRDYEHEPLRLLAVIAAPREAVADIIERSNVLEEPLVNGWMNLVVLDDGRFYQYTTRQSWQQLNTTAPEMN